MTSLGDNRPHSSRQRLLRHEAKRLLFNVEDKAHSKRWCRELDRRRLWAFRLLCIWLNVLQSNDNLSSSSPSSSALTEPVPTYVYVAIAGGIVLVVIVCFCCVRKCCCKKDSSKRNESAPAAVYYHVSSSSYEHSDQLFIMCVFDFYFKFLVPVVGSEPTCRPKLLCCTSSRLLLSFSEAPCLWRTCSYLHWAIGRCY